MKTKFHDIKAKCTCPSETQYEKQMGILVIILGSLTVLTIIGRLIYG